MCRSICVVRKLQVGPSPHAQPLSTHAHTHTPAHSDTGLLLQIRPSPTAIIYTVAPRWLLWDAAPHFIFHHILFHLICSNSNPLNPNVRRRRAPLFGQVKWLQAMMCFSAQSAGMQHTSAATTSPVCRSGCVCFVWMCCIHTTLCNVFFQVKIEMDCVAPFYWRQLHSMLLQWHWG